MTYGYGDDRGEWRPPTRPQGPRRTGDGYPPPDDPLDYLPYPPVEPTGRYDQQGGRSPDPRAGYEQFDEGYDPFAQQPGQYPPAGQYGQPPQSAQPDPYAVQDPYAADPYGQGAMRGRSGVYGRPAGPGIGVYGQQPDPYGQPGHRPDPYGQPPAYDAPAAYAPPGYPPTGRGQRPGQPTGYDRRPEPEPYGRPRSGPAYGTESQEWPGTYVPGQRDAYHSGLQPAATDTGLGRRQAAAWSDPSTTGSGRVAVDRGDRTRTDERPAARRPTTTARKPRAGKGRAVMIVVAVLLVLIGGGAVALFWSHRGSTTTSGSPTGVTGPTTRIASQKVDPKPLTTAEVFGAKITSTASGGGIYKVLGSQSATNCGVAVTDQLETMLTAAGCTQVVRGTLTSPDSAYVITAGIFNLKDEAAAKTAFDTIKSDIGSGKGRFTGFATGGPTDLVIQAQANLAWDIRGHYLMYAVIVLANGQAIKETDARTGLIVTDVVESYFGDLVLGARSAGPAAKPSTSASH